jgi:CubicO group peptidase (beta-lactamase class C family)
VDVPKAATILDERMAQAASTHSIPVVSYGLLLGSELVHRGSIGELPPERAASSPFRIASMTKSFTAATLLLLRDDGLVTLDTPDRTSRHVTSCPYLAPAHDDRGIPHG